MLPFDPAKGQAAFRRGIAVAVPLLGVFFTGLIAVFVPLFPQLGQYAAGIVPGGELVVKASIFSLPLAVYTVLYMNCVSAEANKRRNSIHPALRVLGQLFLFLAIIFIFPYLMLLSFGAMITVIRIGGAFLTPFVVGFIFGGVMSLVVDRRGWRRFFEHALGGGLAGTLVCYLYTPLGAGPVLDLNNHLSVRYVALAGWSAFLLTLCYLPHTLATRPWPPKSGRAVAVLLLGVFLIGLISVFAPLFPQLGQYAGGVIPGGEPVVKASIFSLPLAVYTLLYINLFKSDICKYENTTQITLRILFQLILFVTIMFALPYLVILWLRLVIKGFQIGGAFLSPFVAGFVFGGVVSLAADRRGRFRFFHHELGGGLTGMLVYYLYAPFGAGPVLDLNDHLSVRHVALAGWSAFLLTLCYLPHTLATRPWQSE